MKTLNCRYLLYITVALLAACSGTKKEDGAEEGVTTALPGDNNEVTVQVLKRQPFDHELVSNGKITAGGQADLRFETAGVIAHVYVKNGDRVHKGQKLAELDKFRLTNKTAQAKDALEKAKLELQDVLIGQGYPAGEHPEVPADIMKLARVKSGYDQSLSQYELAKYEEEHATLTAPFDGVVANLFSKPYNVASTSEAFCTIVGTQGMETDFTVLESELPLIKDGDKVVVTPYSDAASGYEGRITQINPLVDDKGMVKVKAAVNGKGKLFSGMNVRINVHRSLGEQLVIPKSAVVLRSGKQVVFTLKDGKAHWNYVHTGLENAESYSLIDTSGECLEEGDTVIVTGNVNLADEAPVKINK
ncbi:efflux RND transporter periplasmic adaptor subunit [Bacteroides helcogenes]|uniref:Efflux transporter, RND family, MFP subunit n=1 Tax=Bacteroides helcogenes (strain ATCC 35417 / DSM 20613 / JCM 6297 / CCUG 15421 / P 36-108) TaxID=693979 RepID=E6SUJ5_BACT6|nr:efflux RND transporter periplasmic adaptor subunit [Bacteroides helcogenes]ADV43359.1 efflux transporter, RND family, MFP subunit [Bacteroides helcogenes P 36-108]MDY5238127.1 efflux RND transporter periplasmic adaptor subunit [Bacteroides helcogenes]